MSRHWASIGEAGALTGLRFMVWVNNRLGKTVFNIVLVPVMSYFFVRRSEARKGSIDYCTRSCSAPARSCGCHFATFSLLVRHFWTSTLHGWSHQKVSIWTPRLESLMPPWSSRAKGF